MKRWNRLTPAVAILVAAISTAGVIAGACGGLDAESRARFGAVVDFVDVHWRGYHWPAFNVADSAITVGAALLIYDSFRGMRRDRPLTSSGGGRTD